MCRKSLWCGHTLQILYQQNYPRNLNRNTLNEYAQITWHFKSISNQVKSDLKERRFRKGQKQFERPHYRIWVTSFWVWWVHQPFPTLVYHLTNESIKYIILILQVIKLYQKGSGKSKDKTQCIWFQNICSMSLFVLGWIMFLKVCMLSTWGCDLI